MENRPVGREKRTVSGGSGFRRGRSVTTGGTSQRGVKSVPGNDKKKSGSFIGRLFGR